MNKKSAQRPARAGSVREVAVAFDAGVMNGAATVNFMNDEEKQTLVNLAGTKRNYRRLRRRRFISPSLFISQQRGA